MQFEQNDGDGEEGSKRSVSWFLDYLKEERGEEKVDQMWRKVGNICVKTVMCILPTLVREYDSKFGTGDKSGLPAKDDGHTCNVLGEYSDKGSASSSASDSSRPSTVASAASDATTASGGASVGTEKGGREEESDEEDSDEDEDSESGESEDEELDSEEDSEEGSEASGRRAEPTVEGSHCFEVRSATREGGRKGKGGKGRVFG